MVFSVVSSETSNIITNNAINPDTFPSCKRYEIQPVSAGNNRSFLRVVQHIDVLDFLNKESPY